MLINVRKHPRRSVTLDNDADHLMAFNFTIENGSQGAPCDFLVFTVSLELKSVIIK